MTRHTLREAAASLALAAYALSGPAASAQVPLASPPLPPPPGGVTVQRTIPARHLVGPPGIAATVNGQAVTKAQVSVLAMQVAGPEILDRIINDMLIDQEAKRLGVKASPTEVAVRFTQVKDQLAQQQASQGLPVQSLDALLAQSHQSMANFRDSLRLRILAEKLVSSKLPPMHMVHARHILVVTNAGINPSLKAHSEDDAKKIIARAQDDLKKGQSWDDVCKKYSEDPSNKDKGGDLGVIGTGMAQIDETFLTAALALKAGEVTPTPIHSIYGYHLIKADSTNTQPSSAVEKGAYAVALASARDAQFKQLIPAYLESLRAKAKVLNYLSP